NTELWTPETGSDAARNLNEPRVVPSQSAAVEDQLGATEQRQHAGERRTPCLELCREEQGDLPRELLAEEQAQRRSRQERSALRLGDPGGAAPSGRGGQRRQSAPETRRRGAQGKRRVHRGQTAGGGGRLRRADGSAVSHARGHVDGHAILRARKPVA